MSDGRAVKDALVDSIATIGENIELSRAAVLSVENGVVASYVHNAIGQNIGGVGVLVALDSAAGNKEELEVVGKKLAMHIAATNPDSVDVDGLNPELVKKERLLIEEKAKESGKPDNVVEKMIEGRLGKFYEEVVLLEQPFVMESKIKIKDLVSETSKKIGSPIKVAGFKHFVLGGGA